MRKTTQCKSELILRSLKDGNDNTNVQMAGAALKMETCSMPDKDWGKGYINHFCGTLINFVIVELDNFSSLSLQKLILFHWKKVKRVRIT